MGERRPRQHRSRVRDGRHGVTLLELMLALSLIAVLAAVSWPMIGRSLNNRRLTLAADQLRADLVRARAKAIHTGSVHLLRFRPQTTEYSIQPRESLMVGGAAGGMGTGGMGTGGFADAPVDVSPGEHYYAQRTLPEGVRFLGADLLVDARAQEALGPLADGNRMDRSNEQPEQILICYPDGATSTARLILVNEEQLCVPIDLRGLTGVVTVGELFLSEELP